MYGSRAWQCFFLVLLFFQLVNKTLFHNNGITEERKKGTMATGKKALDIFQPTTGKRADIGDEVAERVKGRPAATESYQKITVIMYERQILHLDKVALAIREKTGQVVHRAELIRAILDKVAGSLNPEAPDFDKAVQELFPILKG